MKKNDELIACHCGCGQLRQKYDKRGRERRFLKGHQPQYQKQEKNIHYKSEIHTDEKIECACGCGELRLRFDEDGRERTYIWGHRNRFKSGKSCSPQTQFKKGHRLSLESETKRRENISKGRIGIKFTETHCTNISKHRKGIPNPKVSLLMRERIGSKSPRWKGGITSLNKKLRASSMYQIWKHFVFLRDNFTCQNTNCPYCQNKLGGNLHSHHIKKFSDFPDLRFKLGNGITLCEKFHKSIRYKEEKFESMFLNILNRKFPVEVLA